VAYAVVAPTDDGFESLVSTLREVLAQSLPEYMIPAQFVFLDELPLTPSGKIDRRALPAPDAQALSQRPYEAPRGQIETALAAIWSEVLHHERVGRHDNFFELGGHSLAAMHVVSRVCERLGVNMTLRELFKQTSLAALARTLTTPGNVGPVANWSPLVAIKPSGTRPPLFLVHPSTGTVSSYGELATRLPTEQPLYGIEASGLYGDQSVIDDITVMASKYIDAIRTVQDRGPYLLGGWSAGGLIAYEMARQLVQRGENVAFLGLIDAYASDAEHESDQAMQLTAIAAANDLVLDSDVLRELAPEDQLRYFAEVCKKNQLPVAQDESYAENMLNVNNAITRALSKYELSAYATQRYAGDVVLFSCSELLPGEERPDPYYGWQKLVGGEVRLRAVPGNHFTVVRMPHVADLAMQISTSLDESRRLLASSAN